MIRARADVRDGTNSTRRANSEPHQRLIELVKTRGSMLNGCAFCLDLCTGQERAALALTDATTRLPETQDVPDEVCAQAAGVRTEDQCLTSIDDTRQSHPVNGHVLIPCNSPERRGGPPGCVTKDGGSLWWLPTIERSLDENRPRSGVVIKPRTVIEPHSSVARITLAS